LYGCETWSPKLREEHRLRVLENRVLRKIIGPKEEEATGEWRKLHNEQLHQLFCSPYIIHVIKTQNEMHGACGMYGGWDSCIQQGFAAET
jgi:hypothetical protein